jgi:metal-responsive CopG/Arc/MetJ family transcriptional regulator
VKAIKIMLDSDLLRAADSAAKRARVNRSAFIREALRDYLKRLKTQKLETLDRQGYRRLPDDPADAVAWERVAAWPER